MASRISSAIGWVFVAMLAVTLIFMLTFQQSFRYEQRAMQDNRQRWYDESFLPPPGWQPPPGWHIDQHGMVRPINDDGSGE